MASSRVDIACDACSRSRSSRSTAVPDSSSFGRDSGAGIHIHAATIDRATEQTSKGGVKNVATRTDYPRSVPVGRLTDRAVVDYDGNKIGDLDEIVLDMSTGCMDFAVVSFGGFLGIGEKHYFVPEQALHYDPEMGTFRMDVTRDQVEHAPGFAGRDWPDMNDEGYMQSVFSYWGATRQEASWQRPWDPQYRQEHPEMYSQTGTQSQPGTEYQTGQPQEQQYQGPPYEGGQPPTQSYTQQSDYGQQAASGGTYAGAYSGPERRQTQYGRRNTDYQGQ